MYRVGNIEDNVTVTVPAGYLTDGATVPSSLLFAFPKWGNYGPAVVIHDWLCEHGQVNNNGVMEFISRDRIDKIFKEAMDALGVSSVRARLMYEAVDYYSDSNNLTTHVPWQRKLLVERYMMENYLKGEGWELTPEQVEICKR